MAPLTRRRQQAIAGRVLRLQAALATSMARILRRFFADQARRVLRRFRTQKALAFEVKATAEELLSDEERTLLELTVRPIVSQAWLEAGALIGDLVGGAEFVDTDPRLQALLNEAGTRITGIHRETLRAIREVLVESGERGYSTWQIANGVPKDGFRGLRSVVTETYRGRAEMISRTELSYAMQSAAHDRYEEARVSEVDVIDGPGCGLRSHQDPDKANGTRRTLILARQYPLAHPACRRVSTPVLV